MAGLSTKTKAQLGWTAAKTAAQNPKLTRFTVKTGAKTVPPLTKLSFKLGKPIAKRKARSRLADLGETLGEVGETLGEVGRAIFEIGEVVGAAMTAYGPVAARQLGWAEPPKEKRTAPRLAAGAVIGASAVYFLDPKSGSERREQVARLVGSAPPQPDGGPAQAPTATAQTT